MGFLDVPASFNFATDVVDKWAAHTPPLTAMLWSDGKKGPPKKFTYEYFSTRSQHAAHLLTRLGAKKGDRMIILLPRVPAWWEIATAAIRAGIVLCPCTTLAVAKDIEFRSHMSGATIFVGSDASIRNFLQVKKNCPAIKTIIQAAGPRLEEENIYQYETEMRTDQFNQTFSGPTTLSTDPALIYFTSGTTGMPKMVLHNQVSYPLAHAVTGKHWLLLKPGKVYWNLSEQGWAKAAWSWFATWNTGATLFVENLTGAFSPTQMLETLSSNPITTLCAPPTIYRQLVVPKMQKLFERNRPQALEHCVGAGEPLNAEVIRQWKGMSGIDIKDGYGQTETILICGNFAGQDVRPGSMGRPTPGVPLDIINQDGHIMEVGEEGDIAVAALTASGEKIHCICDGYLDREGKTTLPLRAETRKSTHTTSQLRQWYLTGDRGYRDKDGYIWFVGRSDDVINSSGYRIGPFEVESVLKQHPAVQESAVVVSPDPDRGEVVKAFVVLVEGYQIKSGAELALELQRFCKENAAPYKYPRKIQFVEESFLPKTISGKIRRIELRQMEARVANKTKL